MKHPEDFSDAAVNKRSMQAARELAVSARSAKVKKELDNAKMDKKERRPLKEFTDFRTEISEHVGVPAHSMPPNILILRRKTIRQFPNNVMVALYYNDKLGQYFSIPYGSVAPDDAVITPVALKEGETAPMAIPDFVAPMGIENDKAPIGLDKNKAPMGIDKYKAPMSIPTRPKWHYGKQPQVLDLQNLDEAMKHEVGDEVRYRLGAEGHLRVGTVRQIMPEHLVVKRDGSHYKVPKDSVVHNSRTGYTREELNEGMFNSTSYARSKWMQDFNAHAKKQGNPVLSKRDTDRAKNYFVSGHTPEEAFQKVLAGTQLTGKPLKEELNEDAISHLQKVKTFGTDKPLYHKDGSQTKVDPTTANALLTVHQALHPDNRKKFADALEHSKPKFHKMLSFAWAQVK